MTTEPVLPEPETPTICAQVIVHTLDGSSIRLRNTEAPDVMDLVEGFTEGDGGCFSFDLDNGRSQVHVPRAAIARLDIDWELSPWQRLVSWTLATLDRWL